ncbi:unnamed protein product, partial [Rotaria sp. Silwood1]
SEMLASFLQDLILIYYTIGDIYVKKILIDVDDDSARKIELGQSLIMYNKAIILHLKISMHQDENLTFLMYHKLGNVHELLGNLDDAIKNYKNVLKEIETLENMSEDAKSCKLI